METVIINKSKLGLKSEYVQHLTDEDIINIIELLVGNTEDNRTFIRKYIEDDCVLVIFEEKGSKKEFTLYDFFPSNGYNVYYSLPYIITEELYVNYMYKKFGTKYLGDYFRRKHNLNGLEKKLIEARKRCDEDLISFIRKHK